MPNRTIRNVISKQKVITVKGDSTILEAARLMSAERVGSVLVVDGSRLVGIFTERDALNRVLATGADPKTTRISAVMTADPVSVHPDKPLGHALHMMFEGGFRHVPVIENGKPLGMVSARDALGGEVIQFESELKQRDDLAERL